MSHLVVTHTVALKALQFSAAFANLTGFCHHALLNIRTANPFLLVYPGID